MDRSRFANSFQGSQLTMDNSNEFNKATFSTTLMNSDDSQNSLVSRSTLGHTKCNKGNKAVYTWCAILSLLWCALLAAFMWTLYRQESLEIRYKQMEPMATQIQSIETDFGEVKGNVGNFEKQVDRLEARLNTMTEARGNSRRQTTRKPSKKTKSDEEPQEEVVTTVDEFQIEAVHLHPSELDNATRQRLMAAQDGVNVKCGLRTRHGLQVHCEVTNFWVVESHLPQQQQSIITYINGIVLIEKPGLYMIYSQIMHHDVLGLWAYAIVRRSGGQDQTLAECFSFHKHQLNYLLNKTEVEDVKSQCKLNRAVYLNARDELFIKDMYYTQKNRVIKMDKESTFWGLIRLSP